MSTCYIIETNNPDDESFVLESHYALKIGDYFYAHGKVFLVDKLIYISKPNNSLSRITSQRVQIADCKIVKLISDNKIFGFSHDRSQGNSG